jgi:membrane protease YdiL (CAAX protease family)
MNKKVFLNFWQALLIIACAGILYFIFYVGTGIIFKDSYQSDPFNIIREYVSILVYIPFIFWIAKKSNIKIINDLLFPDFLSLIRLIIIIVLVKVIITMPLDKPIDFFKSLTNYRLRLIGSTIRPINFLLDLRLLLIVPIIEEVFFRGLILKQFLKQYSPIIAIVLSSLLFSLYHIDPEHLVLLFILGVVQGILYYKTNSILITSITHIIWNTFSLLTWVWIDLNPLFIIIYLVSVIIVFFLLRMPLKTVKTKMFYTEKIIE